MDLKEKNEIDPFVESFKSAYHKYVSLLGWFRIASWISLFIPLLIVFILIEDLFYLSAPFKTIGLILIIVGSILLTRIWLTHRLLNFRDYCIQLAKDKKLWSYIDYTDLHAKPEKTKVELLATEELRTKLDAEYCGERINDWFSENLQMQKARQRITWASASVLLLMLLSLSWLQAPATRVAAFWKSYEQPNPYNYTITPSTARLAEGALIEPTIEFLDDTIPDEVTFYYKTKKEDNYRVYRLNNQQENNKFSKSSEKLYESVSFVFQLDGFLTDTTHIEILNYPNLKNLAVVVDAPDYTNLPRDTINYPFERIIYPQYSSVTIHAQSATDLDSLLLKAHPSNEFKFSATAKNNWLTSYFSQQNVDSLWLDLYGSNGLNRYEQYPFIMEVKEDLPPVVQWILPEKGSTFKESQSLALVFRATDDYGIRSVQMQAKLYSSFGKLKADTTLMLPPTDERGVKEIRFDWIRKQRVVSKDQLELVLRARDNNEIKDYQPAMPDTLLLEVPSLLAELDQMMESEEGLEEQFDEIDKNQQEREQLSEELKEGLRNHPDQPWRQQRNIQQQVEKQKEIEQKIQQLNEEFEKMQQEMKNSDFLSPETLNAYEEYQKLAKELENSELREALEKMQEQLRNLNPNQFREAFENLEFNEKIFQQRLERTVELFKKLKSEATLDRMAKSLEKMAVQQDSLAKQSENMRNEQQELKEALEKIQQSIDELSTDPPKSRKEDLESLQQQLQKDTDSLNEQMQDLLEQMNEADSKQNRSQQSEQQKDMAKKMRSMQQTIQEQQQSMQGKQLNINITALKSILNGLIVSSELQEDINMQTNRLESRNNGFVDQARKQKAVNDFYRNLSDSLLIVGQEVPELTSEVLKRQEETYRIMERALVQQSEREKNQAVVLERQSLAGINDMGQLVADLLEQLQNQMNSGGSGGSGMSAQQMMEQLQQMGQQQQQINQQLQQMINDMAGERLSQEQGKRLEQLSKQQNEIRKQLQELRKEGVLEGNARLKSALRQLEDQMEDAVRDIRGGTLDEILSNRQQNILSRMLEAQDAINEQGEEERREGNTATDIKRTRPEIDIEELRKLLNGQLENSNTTPFKKDLQELIRQYFERLKEQSAEEKELN